MAEGFYNDNSEELSDNLGDLLDGETQEIEDGEGGGFKKGDKGQWEQKYIRYNLKSEEVKKIASRYDQYTIYPLLWVKDIFGDNIRDMFKSYTGKEPLTDTGLTIQQETAFKELAKLIDAKFAAYYNVPLSVSQNKYNKKIGLSIMSGTGTGKDFFTALLIMYFLDVFPKECRVAATANTNKQLRNVLWSQLARVMNMSRTVNTPNGEMPILRYKYEYLSEKVFLKEYKGTDVFAEAVTCSSTMSPQEQAEVLGGRHAKYMLLVADEATGIPDGVFKPFEGTLTGCLNIMMLIFNPTKTRGFAIDSQYKDKSRWVALRWNAEESELVNPEAIRMMAEKYGKESNPYRIRVLGLPPTAGDDSFISWDWIEDAVKRETTPLPDDAVISALDCGAGGDMSVLCTRKGNKVIQIKRTSKKDPMDLVGWAITHMEGSDVLVVDARGVGHGIYGRLAELKGWRIRRYDGSAKAANHKRFDRVRDECYMKMRSAFEMGLIDIPDDSSLIDQLSALKVKYDSEGRMHIASKAEITNIVGHSVDDVDSLAMTYSVDDKVYRKVVDDDEYKKFRYRWQDTQDTSRGKLGWMSA